MTRKQNRGRKGRLSAAEKIARREECIEKILLLLEEKDVTVIEVAKRFNLLEGTAYTYLTFMAEMGQVRRTGEVGDNNRQLWAAGRETGPKLEREKPAGPQGVVIVPARQVGMWRDWLVAAFFGPARGAAA